MEKKKFVSFYYETDQTPHEIKINPATTALLVIDLQNEFVRRDCGEALAFKERGEWERWIPFHDRLDDIVVPNTKKLLDFFRANKLEVTYGRIACLTQDGRDRSAVQKTPGWNGMLLPVDSYNAQIVDELAPQNDEIIVNKTTDSVTAGTNYIQLMRNIGIDTIVVAGIVTDQCVASTVRNLADESFKVIVAEDCCASATMELHNAELTIMNIIYCDVISSDEVIEIIQKELEGN